MAKVIEALNLRRWCSGAQQDAGGSAYHEFRAFFPENAVEYFVSYYDTINLRRTSRYRHLHRKGIQIKTRSIVCCALGERSLFERRDVVIVASVSCIYGLGSPEAY